MMKKCPECKQDKEFECFSFRNKVKGTRTSLCKDCHKLYHKKRYQENIKSERARLLVSNKKRKTYSRKWLRLLKESSPCKDCGIYYPFYVMDFDHLQDKKFLISRAAPLLCKEKILIEIAKCELVCSNCHRIRTYKRRVDK